MDEMIKKNITSNLIVGQLDEEYIQNLEENFHVGIKRFFDIMSNTVNKDKNESEEIEMSKLKVEWTGSYPCLCYGEWIIKYDDVELNIPSEIKR